MQELCTETGAALCQAGTLKTRLDMKRAIKILIAVFALFPWQMLEGKCVQTHKEESICPYKWRKTSTDYFSRNTPKITFNVGKTMSYAGKIISDVIQTTSDLFSPLANI